MHPCHAVAALVLALASLNAAAQPKAAPPPLDVVVTRVIDGDSLVAQAVGLPPIELRLRDIDAPEICQPWGPEAKQALEEYALGKAAQLTTYGRDSYDRVIGTLTIDGQNLGRRMVQEGHAWSIRTRWDRGPLVKQERQALALKRGLHAATGAIAPKEFRQRNGPCPKT